MVVTNFSFGALSCAYVSIWLCFIARNDGVESALRRGPPGPQGLPGPPGLDGPPGDCPRPWALRYSRSAGVQRPESRPQAEAQFRVHAEYAATASEALSSADPIFVVRRQADASRGPPGFPGPPGPSGPDGRPGPPPRWCREGSIRALVKRGFREKAGPQAMAEKHRLHLVDKRQANEEGRPGPAGRLGPAGGRGPPGPCECPT